MFQRNTKNTFYKWLLIATFLLPGCALGDDMFEPFLTTKGSFLVEDFMLVSDGGSSMYSIEVDNYRLWVTFDLGLDSSKPCTFEIRNEANINEVIMLKPNSVDEKNLAMALSAWLTKNVPESDIDAFSNGPPTNLLDQEMLKAYSIWNALELTKSRMLTPLCNTVANTHGNQKTTEH